jgi:hypothetical protein
MLHHHDLGCNLAAAECSRHRRNTRKQVQAVDRSLVKEMNQFDGMDPANIVARMGCREIPVEEGSHCSIADRRHEESVVVPLPNRSFPMNLHLRKIDNEDQLMTS